MLKGRMILLPVVLLGLCILCLPACEKGVPPDLIAAQEAVEAAKAEGAPDFCPDEYSNAELKLKQAQLLYEDNENDAASEAAVDAQALGKEALNCALLAKQPSSDSIAGLPDELASLKATVYFNFNDNTLLAKEAHKLAIAAKKIAGFSKDHKFFVLIETHADLPGSPDDNLFLTDRRARVVRYYLMQNGVPKSRIIYIPYGETLAYKELLKPGQSKKKAEYKKNQDYRRADLFIVEEKPKGAVTAF